MLDYVVRYKFSYVCMCMYVEPKVVTSWVFAPPMEDPATGRPDGPPPLTKIRAGLGKFSFKSLTFSHFFV